MKTDPAKEVRAIEDLILEAIAAQFYQIDIDTSTLVDLSKPTVDQQQRPNYENCAHFTRFIRKHQPREAEISVGGEIGEVGKENSTPEEFRAYMQGYSRNLSGERGIAKVSIQTGSAHGGMVAPDGSLKRMSVDFSVIETISRIAREEYGLAGAVQHGASTLPESDFGLFPQSGAAEIHLATGFQNIILDHPALPRLLRETMYRWLNDHAAEERKPTDTQEQFLYKARKKALGPFKEALWNLPVGTRDAISRDLEQKFDFLFQRLKVNDTRRHVERHVHAVEVAPARRADEMAERELSGAFVRDDEAGD